MHRVALPALAVAATTVFIGSAVADPPGDRVQGSGENNPTVIPTSAKFNLIGQSGPLGENPKGHMIFHRKDGADFKADVVCMTVVGNLATLAGPFVHSKDLPPELEGGGVIVFVEDNGKKHGQETVDRIAVQRLPVAPTQCPPPVHPNRDPLVKGDIVVQDAQP